MPVEFHRRGVGRQNFLHTILDNVHTDGISVGRKHVAYAPSRTRHRLHREEDGGVAFHSRGEVEVAGVDTLICGVELESVAVGVVLEEFDGFGFWPYFGFVFLQFHLRYHGTAGSDSYFYKVVLKNDVFVLSAEISRKAFIFGCVGNHGLYCFRGIACTSGSDVRTVGHQIENIYLACFICIDAGKTGNGIDREAEIVV